MTHKDAKLVQQEQEQVQKTMQDLGVLHEPGESRDVTPVDHVVAPVLRSVPQSDSENALALRAYRDYIGSLVNQAKDDFTFRDYQGNVVEDKSDVQLVDIAPPFDGRLGGDHDRLKAYVAMQMRMPKETDRAYAMETVAVTSEIETDHQTNLIVVWRDCEIGCLVKAIGLSQIYVAVKFPALDKEPTQFPPVKPVPVQFDIPLGSEAEPWQLVSKYKDLLQDELLKAREGILQNAKENHKQMMPQFKQALQRKDKQETTQRAAHLPQQTPTVDPDFFKWCQNVKKVNPDMLNRGQRRELEKEHMRALKDSN